MKRLPPLALLGIGFAAWTLFGALSAAQVFVQDITSGGTRTLAEVFNIVYFYWAWALVTPLVLRFARPLAEPAAVWWNELLRHVPRAALVIALQTLLYVIFHIIAGRTTVDAFGATYLIAMVRHLAGNVLTYATLIAASAGFAWYRRAQRRELEAAAHALRTSELETTLVRVQLQVLQTQLQPHFLFNTLNIISTLVARRDPVTANRAIARLGDLLRVALDASAAQEVTLAEELRLTRHYLEIVELRFGDRLTITEQVDDTASDLLVPTLILQPLVENAVRHGVGARDDAGRIEIIARRSAGDLLLEVRDDGPGFAAKDGEHGVGLANARARLERLYGAAAEMTLANGASAGGATVTVRIPAHSTPA